MLQVSCKCYQTICSVENTGSCRHFHPAVTAAVRRQSGKPPTAPIFSPTRGQFVVNLATICSDLTQTPHVVILVGGYATDLEFGGQQMELEGNILGIWKFPQLLWLALGSRRSI